MPDEDHPDRSQTTQHWTSRYYATVLSLVLSWGFVWGIVIGAHLEKITEFLNDR